MMPTKAIGVAALFTLSALSFAQDKVKIEPKWGKETSFKLKSKAAFEVGGHSASIDSVTTWKGESGKDGAILSVHHDEFKVVADDNEMPVPVEDYKVTYDHTGTITALEGGISATDALRMFLVGNFYAPTVEVTKDTMFKWDIVKNEKTGLGALKIETTYLGDETIGKNKNTLHKFKQVMTETGTEYSSSGTFYVDNNGHVLKANVTFKGVPIPAAGGDAAGTLTVTPVE
jgi:hypothetical protein